ncbi:MAG: RNB domain-containing ribonuclease, partial [Bacteroidetes bacterium]|nr:RNB domain-containing ribonuclease [Bacteroidota bacterium]
MAKKKSKNKHSKKSQRKVSKPVLRGDIMEVFRTNPGKYYNYKQVSSRLGINGNDPRKMVQEVMNELGGMDMLEAGDKGKFSIHKSQVAQVTGSIDFTKSGAAYVVTDQMDGDVYIPENKTGPAFHGDEVTISITGKRRGKSEGKVTGIVSRAKTQFVGIIDISEKHAFLIPSNSRVHTDFYVDKRKLKGAKNGQKVIVKLIDWAEGKKSPFAEIIEVLGNPGDHQVEMHAIMAEFGLPIEFPQEVLDAADKLPTEITKEEIARRRDFRDRTTFTIDPDDAKDFDDALSLKKLKGGKYEVGVHIADVSHYVKPGTLLDKEAINRATSVYLVDRVVPMLPEVLSN